MIYEELYDSLVTELTDREVELGVLILPSKFDLLAGRSPEEPFSSRWQKSTEYPMLALMETLDSARPKYPFLMYDGHVNDYGHYVVARTVFDWLSESAPGPFPKLRLAE